MKLPFFIARRYFFSRKNTAAVNIITGISVIGYAVGAFALVVLLSALNGFERLIFKSYENYYPDIKIQPASGKVMEFDSLQLDKIKQIKGVFSVAPVIEENAIVQYNDNQVVCLIKGVGNQWPKTVKTDSMLVAGTPMLFNKSNTPFAWMAEGLVYKLGLNSTSNAINIMVPRRDNVGVAQLDMNEDQIGVSAVIRAGEEMDNKLVVVPFSWAESIFEREGYATAVEVATRPGTDNKEVVQSIKNLMGDQVVIYNRYEQNRAVYKMFNTEKWVSFSLMAFVLLLISFNLVGSLSMLVLEKKKDIALLNHIGMRLGAIQGIFFREGLMVSLVGTGIGLSLGVMLVLLQQKFGFITTQSTMAAVYPVALKSADLLLITGLSSGLGISSAIYPALKSVHSI